MVLKNRQPKVIDRAKGRINRLKGTMTRFTRLLVAVLLLVSLGTSFVSPQASAVTNIPVRFVFLLPSDSTDLTNYERVYGISKKTYDWYCGQIGGCYTNQGVSLLRGSKTQAQYSQCNGGPGGSIIVGVPYSCKDSTGRDVSPLESLLRNVTDYDTPTINKPGVKTLIIPAWDTHAQQSFHKCGEAYLDGNMAAIDLYSPQLTDNTDGCNSVGNAVHELGHTFGLLHTTDDTIMSDSRRCTIDLPLRDRTTCMLNTSQVATLRAKPQLFTILWSQFIQRNAAGTTYDAPAVVSKASGKMDLFVRGTNNLVYQQSFNGSTWSGIVEVPGKGEITSAPAVASKAANTIDLVARGNDNGIYQKTWNGSTWANWVNLVPPGATYDAPVLVSTAANRLSMFYRGTDNALYQKTYNGSAWSAPVRITAVNTLGSAPAAVSKSAGKIDVFYRAGTNDNSLINQVIFNGTSWSGPFQIETNASYLDYTIGTPAAVSKASGTIDLFIQGRNRVLYQKTFNGSTWSPTTQISYHNTMYAAPAVVSKTAGKIDLFVRGSEDGVYYKTSQ